MNTLIIEDEPRNLMLLEQLIHQHCSRLVQLQGNANSIESAIALIRRVKPELVLLDIELLDGSAFDLLEALGEYNFQVIFVTAYNEFALKALRMNAVDYLLKPINPEELKHAIQKANDKIGTYSREAKVVDTVNYFKSNPDVKKIGINVNGGVVFISVDDIIKIEARANYSIIMLTEQRKITSIKKMKDFEQSLPVHHFARLHHSWMVNINFVKKYYRGKNSYVEMEDGTTVPVSTRKKDRINSFFNL